MLRALAIFKLGRSVSLKCFQRLLELMVAAVVMCQAGTSAYEAASALAKGPCATPNVAEWPGSR